MSFYQERKKDYFYKQAKKEGYRARSAYKLKQLQKKFYVIKKGDVIVDLGAAPGGWIQVAAECTGKKGIVVGIDKESIEPFNLSNIILIQSSIQSKDLVPSLLKRINQKKVNVILSDLAGNLTGNWALDCDRQNYLATLAFGVCSSILKQGGVFVTKIFRGGSIKDFEFLMKQNFKKVKIYRPSATRKQSSEEYFVCSNYTGLT